MDTSLPALLSDGIIIEQAFPLRWRSLDIASFDSEQITLSRHNGQILRVLASIEEGGPEPDSETDTLSRELRCLDDKLDLVLSMLGTLLVRDSALPAATPTWLGAKGLMFVVTAEAEALLPPENAVSLLELFLEPRFPQPLRLPVRLEPAGQGSSGCQMLAVFRDVGTEVTELLEKFIFRQHRRAIALSRQSATSQ